MVHLRKRKKQCKAARKALIKAGLKGTPEEEIITKEWLSLVRQHNKLRISLNKKQSIKDKLQAEKSFRSNPHKFTQNLFSKEQILVNQPFLLKQLNNTFKKHAEMRNVTMFTNPCQNFNVLNSPLICFHSAVQLNRN